MSELKAIVGVDLNGDRAEAARLGAMRTALCGITALGKRSLSCA